MQIQKTLTNNLAFFWKFCQFWKVDSGTVCAADDPNLREPAGYSQMVKYFVIVAQVIFKERKKTLSFSRKTKISMRNKREDRCNMHFCGLPA